MIVWCFILHLYLQTNFIIKPSVPLGKLSETQMHKVSYGDYQHSHSEWFKFLLYNWNILHACSYFIQLRPILTNVFRLQRKIAFHEGKDFYYMKIADCWFRDILFSIIRDKHDKLYMILLLWYMLVMSAASVRVSGQFMQQCNWFW